MKISQYVTLFDTCVLAPMPVVDTILRLAEEPAFYVPKWSTHIIQELEKILVEKFKFSKDQVDRRIRSMELAFPSARVTGYDGLIDSMTNDLKDRHVLAAAVKCGAHSIVTDNVRHFPLESLDLKLDFRILSIRVLNRIFSEIFAPLSHSYDEETDGYEWESDLTETAYLYKRRLPERAN